MKKLRSAATKTLEVVGTALILFGLSIDDRASASPGTAFNVTLIMIVLGAGCI